MQKNYDKRQIRKSLSPVVAPKKSSPLINSFIKYVLVPTVRFSDNEEDLLIKTSPKKVDPSLKKTVASLKHKQLFIIFF